MDLIKIGILWFYSSKSGQSFLQIFAKISIAPKLLKEFLGEVMLEKTGFVLQKSLLVKKRSVMLTACSRSLPLRALVKAEDRQICTCSGRVVGHDEGALHGAAP